MEAQAFTCCRVRLALQVAVEHLGQEGFLILGVALLEKACMVSGQWQVEASKILGVLGQLKVVEGPLEARVVMGVKPFT